MVSPSRHSVAVLVDVGPCEQTTRAVRGPGQCLLCDQRDQSFSFDCHTSGLFMCTFLVKVVYPVFLNVCCVFMCQETLAFNARHVGTDPSYTECHQGNLYMAPS